MKLVRKPPTAGKQYEIFRREARKNLKDAANSRAQAYGRAVAFFDPQHRPRFQGQIISGPNRYFIRTVMLNGNKVFNRYGTTVRALWEMWNKGTRPHTIVPRFASILRFVARSGDVVFTTLVNHPGTRGTQAKTKIDRRLRSKERQAVDNALKKAFKALEKFNSR